jgi:hypothetical protein
MEKARKTLKCCRIDQRLLLESCTAACTGRSNVGFGPFVSIDTKAESGPSLQVPNRKGSAKKADTRGRDQVFQCANAANDGSEPSFPISCGMAKAGND